MGVWRPSPEDRLRDVIVSFGDATLVLSDPKSETPLTHWSLPAIQRLNPGATPAIYAPAEDETPAETLEIDDALMIQAIDRIHRAIALGRPHPGRLRGGLTLGAALVMIVAGLLWLPDALTRHAAGIVPPAERSSMGREILADMAKSTGAACERRAGRSVLDQMAQRLTGPGTRIEVLPAGPQGAVALPGGLFVVGDMLISDQPGPEVLAGHIVAADLRARAADPTLALLDHAGIRPVLTLLTTGHLPASAMSGYGAGLLSQPITLPASADLLAALGEKGLPSEPLARNVDPAGTSLLPLIEGDPYRSRIPPPLMDDRAWVALQQICTS